MIVVTRLDRCNNVVMPPTNLAYDEHERRRDNHEIFDRLNKVEQSLAVMQTKADGYVTMAAIQTMLIPFERSQLSLENKLNAMADDIREGQAQNKIQNDKMVAENEKMLEKLAEIDSQKSSAQLEAANLKNAALEKQIEDSKFVNQLKNHYLPVLTALGILLSFYAASGLKDYLHVLTHAK